MTARFATVAFLAIAFTSVTNADEPVKASKEDTVKDNRYMKSDVTLYKNGKMVIETKSWSRKNFQGLKGQSVFVVCVDDKGNTLWASKAFRCTTVGGTKDLGTASEHKDVNNEECPEAIGKHTNQSTSIIALVTSLKAARAK